MKKIFLAVMAVVVVAGCASAPAVPQVPAPTHTLPAGLEQKIDQMTQAIQALNTKVGQVEAGVNTTTQAIQGLTAKVTQVEQANTALDTRVGLIETRVQAQLQAISQALRKLEQGSGGVQSASPSGAVNPPAGAGSGVVNPPPSGAIMAGPTAYLAHVGERPTDWMSSRLAVWIKNEASFYLSLKIENRPVNFVILRGGLRNPAGEIGLLPGQTAWLLVERTGRFSLVAEGWELNPATNQRADLGRATATLTVDSASGGGGYSFEAFQFH